MKNKKNTGQFPPKTGIRRWIKSGQTPTGRGMARVRKGVEDIETRLIDALGGAKEITPQQEILIRGTSKALGVCYLVELYLNKEGPIRKDLLKRGIVELQPCLGKNYLSFLNTIRQNVMALGLTRKKANEILDLGKYIEAKAQAKAAPSSDTPSKDEAQGDVKDIDEDAAPAVPVDLDDAAAGETS